MVDIGIQGGKFCVVQETWSRTAHQLCLCLWRRVAAEGEERDGENVSVAQHAEGQLVKNEHDVEEGGPSAERNGDNKFFVQLFAKKLIKFSCCSVYVVRFIS